MDSRRLPLSGHDRKLAEEVVFLHSLWHQGPPPNRNRSRNPTLGADLRDPGSPPPRDAQKRRRKKRSRGKVDSSDRTADVQPSESGGLPWPVEELPPPSTEWPPEKKMRPDPEPAPPLTPEEQAKVDAAISQQKAVKASQLFFEELYKEDEEGAEEDDEEAIEFEDDPEKLKIYTFFIDIFTKDPILRQHYEKSSEFGEFNCLACAGIGMKGLKKYRNCVAILQHAHSTVTTKRKKGHRAFARAVCKVLGYNFTRLPSLVLDDRGRLGESLAENGKAQKEDGIEEENQEHAEKQENEDAVEEENQEHVEKQENEDAVEEENIEDDVEEENTEDDPEEENIEDDVEEENIEGAVEKAENKEDDAEEENIEDDVEEENIEGAAEKAENKEDDDQVENKNTVEEENIEDPTEEEEDIFAEVENKDAAGEENTEDSVEKGENIDAIEDEMPPENITNNLTENPLES